MPFHTLTAAQEQALSDERIWLGRLLVALARLDLDADDVRALERSIRQLDRLFLLVIVGEFNAGKSAFINALLGERVLEEGVTPTTTRLQATRYGPVLERSVELGDVAVVSAPVELLRNLEIVDTPGTNAIFREHEALTTEFVPRADLVIFVTSADRPFTESERAFLQSIREWGKKLIVVINKVDILETAADVDQVTAFVQRGVETLLGVTPEIFPVSARLAMRRKMGEIRGPAPGDRFEALEAFLADTLDESERIRLKLLNPIGVADRLMTHTQQVVDGRLDLLREDLTTLDDLDRQLDVYRSDMQREFRFRLSHADKELHEFENRGVAFFDDVLRLGRVFDLLNKSRLKSEFEQRVVADMPRTIEKHVHEIIDWMVASDLRQWQAVMERVRRRQAAHRDRMMDSSGLGFTYDRARLLDTVGRAAEQAVDSYDREREANQLAESVKMAVAGTAIAQAGAIGLGTAVTALATTTFADVTGILAAGTIAALGLFVIPMRRRQAKSELRQKIASMRTELMGSLTAQFEREIVRSLERIRDAVAPYSRFVRAERDRFAGARDELIAIKGALATIRARIVS
jgi:small GTP-binding protein